METTPRSGEESNTPLAQSVSTPVHTPREPHKAPTWAGLTNAIGGGGTGPLIIVPTTTRY